MRYLVTAARWSELTCCEQRGDHGYNQLTVIDPASGVRHVASDVGLLAAMVRTVMSLPATLISAG